MSLGKEGEATFHSSSDIVCVFRHVVNFKLCFNNCAYQKVCKVHGRPGQAVAEVVFSVCSSTSTVLNHSMEYNVVMSIGYYYRLELIVSKVFCNLVDSVIL